MQLSCMSYTNEAYRPLYRRPIGLRISCTSKAFRPLDKNIRKTVNFVARRQQCTKTMHEVRAVASCKQHMHVGLTAPVSRKSRGMNTYRHKLTILILTWSMDRTLKIRFYRAWH